MMLIDKTMCIGGLCEGFLFCDMFGTRIVGPVDNWTAKNFKATLDLFNGKMFDDVLNDKITKKIINPWYQDYNDDKYLRTYDNWRTGHNNLEIQNRKDEFKKRIDNFNQFNIDVQNGSQTMYYIYTIAELDNETLTKEDFDYTCEHLPKYVIDHLIIIGGTRHPILPWFKLKFRCIEYNIDLDINCSDNNKLINNLWNDKN